MAKMLEMIRMVQRGELKINFLKPVWSGKLTATFVDCDVHDEK